MNGTDSRVRFAANVRRQRELRGLSQEGLAAACGLHRTEISLLERGGRDPRLSTILRLARGLGVGAPVLVEGVDESAEATATR